MRKRNQGIRFRTYVYDIDCQHAQCTPTHTSTNTHKQTYSHKHTHAGALLLCLECVQPINPKGIN